MNKKHIYTAPAVELIKIQIESCVLTTLSGGEGTANGTTMKAETWSSWDE